MTQEQYLKRFEEICQELIEVTRRKGNDYAGQSNVFRNFELIETLTEGRISTADGLIVRLTDKLMRAANLLTRNNSVADERIYDTTKDAAAYSIILTIWLEQLAEKGQPETAQRVEPGDVIPITAPGETIPDNLYQQIMRRLREAA